MAGRAVCFHCQQYIKMVGYQYSMSHRIKISLSTLLYQRIPHRRHRLVIVERYTMNHPNPDLLCRVDGDLESDSRIYIRRIQYKPFQIRESEILSPMLNLKSTYRGFSTDHFKFEKARFTARYFFEIKRSLSSVHCLYSTWQ
jgi:hypothetical protein